MFQRSFQHPRQNLHVSVAMPWKARTTGHTIFVDHPQCTEPHLFGVMICVERKTVAAVQPANIGVPAIRCFSNVDHFQIPEYCLAYFARASLDETITVSDSPPK